MACVTNALPDCVQANQDYLVKLVQPALSGRFEDKVAAYPECKTDRMTGAL